MTDPTATVACPHGDRCGGCTRLGQPYGEQLAAKRARLATALAPYPDLRGVVVDETRGADPIVGYRTRAKLVVDAAGHVGLYAKGGKHEVVDIPECRVMAPVVKATVDAVRATLGASQQITSIDVRECVADEEQKTLLTLGMRKGSERDGLEKAGSSLSVALTEREPSIASVAVSEVERGPQLLGRHHRVVMGSESVRDHFGDEPYEIASHGAFVQSHRGQAVAIRRAVIEALGDVRDRVVVDAFAGAAGLGFSLAKRGAHVIAIESYPPAAERAVQAAREQSLTLDVRNRDATEALAYLANAATTPVDTVIVNPPRRGLAPALRDALGRLVPRIVAYVSCDPDTLARDLAHLARLGLRAARATPWDMIPLTDEVETLCVLSQAEPPPPRVLHEDESLVVVDKDPHEPTTPQSEWTVSTLARVRTLRDCADAVPVHRLDEGTSGVCLFAKRPADVARWQAALAAGEKEYTALVRGIPHAKGSISRPLADEGARRPARTRFARRKILGGHGLLSVRPDEGRTHQVRRHLASIGHAVVGDSRYGHAPSNRHFEEKHGLDRTFLHCARITLGPLELKAPLAPDLACVLAQLEVSPRST